MLNLLLSHVANNVQMLQKWCSHQLLSYLKTWVWTDVTSL